jgi:hypothetical protein
MAPDRQWHGCRCAIGKAIISVPLIRAPIWVSFLIWRGLLWGSLRYWALRAESALVS